MWWNITKDTEKTGAFYSHMQGITLRLEGRDNGF
jgi:hypothetical protein